MFVKVSETYDLSTKVNKMGFLGIHTPDGPLVHDHYSGLFQNFKKFRYVSCDVAMACASMLPADPLQIGVEAGDIAPQDMFNPILYKACSNDSMSTLLNRLYAGQAGASSSAIAKNSVVADNDVAFGYNSDNDVDQFAMYYGLLSDTSGWKKAMPQQGLTMTGLRPLTFGILATQGQPSIVGDFGDGASRVYYPSVGADNAISTSGFNPIGRYMRGPTQPMPSMDTYVMLRNKETSTLGGSEEVDMPAYTGTYPEMNVDIHEGPAVIPSVVVPNISTPDCFVGAIILPPAKLNRLYYRLKITWTIEFSGVRSLTDLTSWYGLAVAGVNSYGSDYETQSAIISKTATQSANMGMVDVGDTEIVKVMEGSR
ncbi:capsid protein [Felismacovirus babas1]|uniref:Capsid protein n=1 Tax=Papio kindae associated smacovirus TaxID=2213169 RepID=A0A455R3Q8_9VIRU|nr:capsid protein [Papio kindae associated smacovirus]